MEDGRRNLQFIAVKTYYRPKELVEMLDATEKDIVRFAYGVGSLYEAEEIRLVNLPMYMGFLNSYQAFMDDSMGTYMELDDAVKKNRAFCRGGRKDFCQCRSIIPDWKD